MAEPYVKDSAITYNQFENIYNMLSLREKYDVTEILYKNGIDLIADEEQEAKESFILEPDIEDGQISEDGIIGDEFSILYDEDLFKDSKFKPEIPEVLVVDKNVKQSNEILCTLIQQGSAQATQDLCIKNRRLVEVHAAAYSKWYRHHLDVEDLIQVGFMGLIKAAQKFDIKMGYSFSTYAVWWIKQSITREIMDNGYAIRIPVHVMEKINKMQRIEGKYMESSYEERVKCIANEMDMSEEMVREYMRLKANVISYASLNTPIGEDEEAELGDYIPMEDSLSVEDIVTEKELRRYLEEALGTLKDREQQVLRMRFGLDGGRPRTLEEVGKCYGITRERIRQIESKALRVLRHRAKKRKLEEFL